MAFGPHHAVIRKPGEVQIYESVMGDVNGRVTTRLLRGARYLKDNRLLPRGLRRSELDEVVAIAGRAAEDTDFRAGADRVRFEVPVGAAQEPFTVTVELLYQSVGYRWRENLRKKQGELVKTFLTASDKVPNAPVTIARQSRLVKCPAERPSSPPSPGQRAQPPRPLLTPPPPVRHAAQGFRLAYVGRARGRCRRPQQLLDGSGREWAQTLAVRPHQHYSLGVQRV